MPEQSVSVNRTLVGVIAVACLAAGLVIAVVDSYENLWCAAFIRVGLVTGAFWIAMPSRGREAAWANVSPYTLLAVLVGALMFVRLRLWVFLPLLVVVLAIGLLLRPRRDSRPRASRERKSR